MRGKVVNFCMALLNLLIGISILVYTIKIPKEITELTVQEYNIVNVVKIIMYVGLGLANFLNVIHYFLNGRDGMRKTGYLVAVFSVSFVFIKEWPICIFSFISAIIITISTIRERWMETNSITAISIIGIIAVVVFIPTIACFVYKGLGSYILKKENENEQSYNPNFFKYITELDIQEPYINVQKNGKYGYIIPNGTVVINYTYDFASPFVNISVYDKKFQVALVCLDGQTKIIMKNLREVMTYRSESMDEDYKAKLQELEDIYYNTLNQTEKMKYEIETNYNSSYRLPAYENQTEEGVIKYNYSDEYDIVVTKSSLGFGDSYYLSGKGESGFKLPLDCEHLDYDDNYLYIFSNGTIPYYDTSVKKQGWFTKAGTKITLSGKAQILEIVDDKILIKNHNNNTIYFIDNKNDQISDTYKEVFICGYDRLIVKNSKNKYMVIDFNFQKVFESEWDFVDTSLAQVGIFVFGNLKDWEAEFNPYDFAENMNLTMIDYMGNVVAENVQQVYNKYYYISNDEKKSTAEKYSDFIDSLKVMKYKFIGDQFYQ